MGQHNEIINLDLKGLEKLKVVEDFLNKNKEFKIEIPQGRLKDFESEIDRLSKKFSGIKLENGISADQLEKTRTLKSLLESIPDRWKTKIEIDATDATTQIKNTTKEINQLHDTVKALSNTKITPLDTTKAVSSVTQLREEFNKLQKESSVSLSDYSKLQNKISSLPANQKNAWSQNLFNDVNKYMKVMETSVPKWSQFQIPADAIKGIEQYKMSVEGLNKAMDQMKGVKIEGTGSWSNISQLIKELNSLTKGGYEIKMLGSTQFKEWESIISSMKQLEKTGVYNPQSLNELEGRINNILNQMSTPIKLNLDTSDFDRIQKYSQWNIPASAGNQYRDPIGPKKYTGLKNDFDVEAKAASALKSMIESIPSEKKLTVDYFDYVNASNAVKAFKADVDNTSKSTESLANTNNFAPMIAGIQSAVGATEKLSVTAQVTSDQLAKLGNTSGLENFAIKASTSADETARVFTVSFQTIAAELSKFTTGNPFESLVIKSKSAADQVANDWSSAVSSIDGKLNSLQNFTFGAAGALGGSFSGDFLFDEAKQRNSMLWRLTNQNPSEAKSIADQFVQYDLQSSRSDHDLVQMMGWLQNSLQLRASNATDALSTLDAVSADMDSLRQRGKMWAWARYLQGGWDSSSMAFRDEGLTEEMKTMMKQGDDTLESRIEVAKKIGEMQGAFRTDSKGNVKGMYNDMEGQVGGTNAALALLDNFVQAGTIGMQNFVNAIKPVTMALMSLTQGNMDLIGGLMVLVAGIAATGGAVQLFSFAFEGITKTIKGIGPAIEGAKSGFKSLIGIMNGSVKPLDKIKEVLGFGSAADDVAGNLPDKKKTGDLKKLEDVINSTPDGDGSKTTSKSLNFTKWATNIVKAGGLIIVGILMVVPILAAMVAPMLMLAAIGKVYKSIEGPIKDGIGGLATSLPAILGTLVSIMAVMAIADKLKWTFTAGAKNIIGAAGMIAVGILGTAVVLATMLAPMAALAAVGYAFQAIKGGVISGIEALKTIVPIVVIVGVVMSAIGALVLGSLGTVMLAAVTGMAALAGLIIMVSVPLLAMIAPLVAIAAVGHVFQGMKSQVIAGVEGIKSLAETLKLLNEAMVFLTALNFTAIGGAIGTFVGLPAALMSIAETTKMLKEVIPKIDFDIPKIDTTKLKNLTDSIKSLAEISKALDEIAQSGNKITSTNGTIEIDKTWTQRLKQLSSSMKELKPVIAQLEKDFGSQDWEGIKTITNGVKNLAEGLKSISQSLADIPANKIGAGSSDTGDWAPSWGEKLQSIQNNLPILKGALQQLQRSFGEEDWTKVTPIVDGVKNLASGLKSLGDTFSQLPANKVGWDWAPTWGEKLTSIYAQFQPLRNTLDRIKSLFKDEDWAIVNPIINGVKNLAGSLTSIATTINQMPENTSGIDMAMGAQTWTGKLTSLYAQMQPLRNTLNRMKDMFGKEDWGETVNPIVNGIKNLVGSLGAMALELDNMPEPTQDWGSKYTDWQKSIGGINQAMPQIFTALDTMNRTFNGAQIGEGGAFTTKASQLATITTDLSKVGKSLSELGSDPELKKLNAANVTAGLDKIKKVFEDDKFKAALTNMNTALSGITVDSGMAEKATQLSTLTQSLKGIAEGLKTFQDAPNIDVETVGEKLGQIGTAIGIMSPMLGLIQSMPTIEAEKMAALATSLTFLGPIANSIVSFNESVGEVGDLSPTMAAIGSIVMIASALAPLASFNVIGALPSLFALTAALWPLGMIFAQIIGLGGMAAMVSEAALNVATAIVAIGAVMDAMANTIASKGSTLYTNSFNASSKISEGFKNGLKSFTTSLVTTPLNAASTAASNAASKFWTAGARCGSSLVNGFRSGTGINSPGIIQKITMQEINDTIAGINGKASEFWTAGATAGAAAAKRYKELYGSIENPHNPGEKVSDAANSTGGNTTVNFNGPTFGEFSDEVLRALAKDKEQELISSTKWG